MNNALNDVNNHISNANPANTRRWPNVGLLLGQRRRRWPNSKPTLGQRLIFAGKRCRNDIDDLYDLLCSNIYQEPDNLKKTMMHVSKLEKGIEKTKPYWDSE